MPFPWYEPDVPEEFLGAPDKARAMYENELRQRATLLLRLGYSADEVKLRLRGNVRWDFEVNAPPAHLDSVDRIADSVFTARRAGVGGPPSLD